MPKSRSLSSVALGARVISILKKMSKNFEPTSHAKGVALKHHHTMVSFEKKVGRRHEIYLKCKGDMNAKAAFCTSFLTMTS